MPVRFRPLLALGALVLALSLAAPVAAQNAPTLGAPQTQTDTAAPPPETTSSGGGGLKTWQEVLIFAAGVPHKHSQAAKQRARAKARQARKQRRKNR